MYVDPLHRNHGVGQALLDALEQHASLSGLHWLYLDTREDLRAAISRYVDSGFSHCDRYNDNQEVTIFMRKQLQSEHTRAQSTPESALFEQARRCRCCWRLLRCDHSRHAAGHRERDE